jgi:hypothetical protein
VVEIPCEAAGRAYGQGVLRLRCRALARTATSLRMTECGWDGTISATFRMGHAAGKLRMSAVIISASEF